MKTIRTIFLLGIFTMLAFAQGSMEIKRPSSESDPGSTSWSQTNCGIAGVLGSSSMANSYDAAGQATSSTLTTTATTSNKVKTRLFSTWQSTANSYSALTLNVNASGAGPTDTSGKVCVVYSTDSGTTYSVIRCDSFSYAQATSSVTLSATQPLSALRVGVCVFSGTTSSDAISVYDIWTSGTLGSAAAGNGSGSGTAVQPVTFN